MSIDGAISRQVIATIYDDLVKYYGLYSFTKWKIKRIFKKPLRINSCEHFWSLLLGDQFINPTQDSLNILNGQPVTFSNSFYISEWAPKIPGKIWTKSGQKSFDEALGHTIIDKNWHWTEKYEIVLDEYGKKKAMEAGFGSVRINPSKNPNEMFMYMSLTTPDNWDIDSGIPVIASKAVFEEFRRKSINNGAVEIGKLEGILIIDTDLPFNEIISSAIGADVDKKIISSLTKQPFLPKCYVYIPSSLGVNFKFNNSHPECTGWTMYRKNITAEWQKNYQQKADYEYGLTYNCFDPTKPDTIVEATDFMKDYAHRHNGAEIITDFDGIQSRFDSRLSLGTNPEETQAAIFESTLNEIHYLSNSIKTEQ